MGLSRFCEWEETSTIYETNYGFTGACTPHCTSWCNNCKHEDFVTVNNDNNVAVGGGCFKCYGLYPGMLGHQDKYWPDPHYYTAIGSYMFDGPCLENP